jgi:predicted PurR-regulated permease PerM
MINPARISYILIALTLVLVIWLHLAVPLLAVLFSLFVLNKLHFTKSKWIAILLFVIVISGTTYAAVHFGRAAWFALPRIADTSIPSVLEWAQSKNIELPFTDYTSLRELAMNTVREQIRALGTFAKGATTALVMLIIGIVVAISIFLNSKLDLARHSYRVQNNLYSLCCEEIALRFLSFYESFATVMGAQIVISTINTALTSIFLVIAKMPYAPVVAGVTFLCGLLPVIGNLLSNTIIVCIAFTVSPKLALASLIFLIVIHKLEYFLNSKIIGERIRNPVWLTLLGLVIGERLMGLPGMILAPVVLNYIRVEASQIEVIPVPEVPPTPPANPPAS